jgi:DNA mismatch repair protein MSH6
MVKIKDPSETTPARPPSLKKQNSSAASNKNQRSILGFFSKTASNDTKLILNSGQKFNILANGNAKSSSVEPSKKPAFSKAKSHNITPVPSSDAAQPPSSQDESMDEGLNEVDNGLLLPLTPVESNIKQVGKGKHMAELSSPSRKVRLIYKLVRNF